MKATNNNDDELLQFEVEKDEKSRLGIFFAKTMHLPKGLTMRVGFRSHKHTKNCLLSVVSLDRSRRAVRDARSRTRGGVDLDADAALWEDFLTGLKLSSPILGNRIRRELMRRRNALCEAPPPKPSSASPSPTKGRGRRLSGGGIVRACPIQ